MGRTEQNRVRRGLNLSRLVVAIGTFALVGCSPRNEMAIPAISVDSEATSFEFEVPTCDGSPEAEVIETPEEVRVKVVSTTSPACGTACIDLVTVRLQEPVGDRKIIDESTGEEVQRL